MSEQVQPGQITPAHSQEHEGELPVRGTPATPGLPPGWSVPRDHVPRPTYWPVVMSLGITFIFFGIVTTFVISVIGLVLFAISTVGWIGDVQNEQREQAEHH